MWLRSVARSAQSGICPRSTRPTSCPDREAQGAQEEEEAALCEPFRANRPHGRQAQADYPEAAGPGEEETGSAAAEEAAEAQDDSDGVGASGRSQNPPMRTGKNSPSTRVRRLRKTAVRSPMSCTVAKCFVRWITMYSVRVTALLFAVSQKHPNTWLPSSQASDSMFAAVITFN